MDASTNNRLSPVKLEIASTRNGGNPLYSTSEPSSGKSRLTREGRDREVAFQSQSTSNPMISDQTLIVLITLFISFNDKDTAIISLCFSYKCSVSSVTVKTLRTCKVTFAPTVE